MSLSLTPHSKIDPPSGPLLVIVADGFGCAPDDPSNAISEAETPHLDALFAEPLTTILAASGTAVGLPSDDDMGNSEVGHNAIGAGRVFSQGALLVNQAIDDGSLYGTDVWQRALTRAQAGGTLHFLGLHSDGNVHSHTDHLYAM
ncbi:MAG: 2,3-bisphosphoglycerate-independent phosphoglycerate mutase, partial [Acidimicrobiales bacterium]